MNIKYKDIDKRLKIMDHAYTKSQRSGGATLP